MTRLWRTTFIALAILAGAGAGPAPAHPVDGFKAVWAGQHAVHYTGHAGSQKAFMAIVHVDPQAKIAAIFASNTVDPALPAEETSLRQTHRDLFENLFPVSGK